MNNEEVLSFTYKGLDSEDGIIDYAKIADTYNLRKGTHSKPKNYVINNIYSADIASQDRDIFIFMYDLLSQQKYVPDLQINNVELSKVIGKNKSTIGDIINRLKEYNLIMDGKNIYGYDTYILNENINTWNISIDKSKLDFIEMQRKRLAGFNKHLEEKYKDFKSMQQLVG